jgi:hypothetical protein
MKLRKREADDAATRVIQDRISVLRRNMKINNSDVDKWRGDIETWEGYIATAQKRINRDEAEIAELEAVLNGDSDGK